MRWCLGVAALATLATFTKLACAADTISLRDSTFEHDTQVATGATTGNWIVRFHQRAKTAEVFDELAPELREYGVIAAELDCEKSPKTCARFELAEESLPRTIFFRRGYLCEFRGKLKAERLLDFVLELGDLSEGGLSSRGCRRAPKEGAIAARPAEEENEGNAKPRGISSKRCVASVAVTFLDRAPHLDAF